MAQKIFEEFLVQGQPNLGADVNVKNNDGKTAENIAREAGNLKWPYSIILVF